MPHYVDGTPAKHGDLVMKRDAYTGPSLEVVGIVVLIQPGSDTCNLQLLPLAVRQKDSGAAWTPMGATANLWYVTAKECQRLVQEVPVAACAAAGALYFGGKAIGHGVKVVAIKTKHAVVHVVHPKKADAKK